ncbi:MAG: RNA-binding S4 domain-containing protein [Rikenellaceae bacterium]
MTTKESERIDKWLWAIRAYKTRSIATEACKSGKVQINGMNAKASKEVRVGDTVSVRKMPVVYSFKVLAIISGRVGAKLVPDYAQNITSSDELDKLYLSNHAVFMQRDRGAGRPTKKDRRDIDDLMQTYFFDSDDDEKQE